MKPSGDSQLLAAFAAEHAALKSFVALLEREQRMLVENCTDRLLELSEQKSGDALRLDELARARRALLKKNLPQFGTDTVRAWLAAHSPEGLAIWEEILALADRASRINHTNGELIQTKLRHNQQTLTVLSNAANKSSLYGPDGQPSFSPGSGRPLGSG